MRDGIPYYLITYENGSRLIAHTLGGAQQRTMNPAYAAFGAYTIERVDPNMVANSKAIAFALAVVGAYAAGKKDACVRGRCATSAVEAAHG